MRHSIHTTYLTQNYEAKITGLTSIKPQTWKIKSMKNLPKKSRTSDRQPKDPTHIRFAPYFKPKMSISRADGVDAVAAWP